MGDKKFAAFAKFAGRIKSERRIITSHESLIVPRSCSQRQLHAVGKPNGLWYSCGSSWIEWCGAEEFQINPYVHEIRLDMSRIRVITSVPEFDEFSSQFGMGYWEYHKKLFGSEYNKYLPDAIKQIEDIYGFAGKPDYIDWWQVTDLYAGIEICPYLWERRLEGGLWYYGWDCASGCVWDASAVADVKLIAKYDEKEEKVIACV
jgi:hypothetical protein